MNEHITLPLLKELQKNGFTTLIASAQAGNDLAFIPSKEPANNELIDDASIHALSMQEVLGIQEVIDNFSFYADKGIEIEVDNGE